MLAPPEPGFGECFFLLKGSFLSHYCQELALVSSGRYQTSLINRTANVCLIKVLPYHWIWSQNTQCSEWLTIPCVSMHNTNLTTSSPQFNYRFYDRKKTHSRWNVRMYQYQWTTGWIKVERPLWNTLTLTTVWLNMLQLQPLTAWFWSTISISVSRDGFIIHIKGKNERACDCACPGQKHKEHVLKY